MLFPSEATNKKVGARNATRAARLIWGFGHVLCRSLSPRATQRPLPDGSRSVLLLPGREPATIYCHGTHGSVWWDNDTGLSVVAHTDNWQWSLSYSVLSGHQAGSDQKPAVIHAGLRGA